MLKLRIFVLLIFAIIIACFIIRAQEETYKVIVDVSNASEKSFFGLVEKTLEKDEVIEDIGKEKVINNFIYSDSFSAELTKKDIEKLEDRNVKIRKEKVFNVLLQDSIGIINATRTWSLQQSGLNLTGINQAVCIIDTGVNYSHSDLGGCYGNNTANSSCKVLGGWDYVNSDNNPYDDNGHGTHVAGIIAANGSIKGVAPDAKIIVIKALNSTGSGTEGNINSGIEWCVNNASVFNITVITMSLGSDTLYNNYCDSYYSDTFAASINAAVAKNISVVIASGNNGNYTAISSPACITNATAIGWANKDDTINTNSNRNLLVKLMAPGTDINSTGGPFPGTCTRSGNYMSCSGTSMAVPHVAGAIAIIKQFLALTNQEKTPKEIETTLNNTGKIINDASSGLNFSRINIYDAIISLDIISPNVILIYPENNSQSTNLNQTFRCNATDLSLRNLTFYLWNSSNSIINQTSQTASGNFYLAEFNMANLSYGNYKWNCLVYDEKGNSALASFNFTLTIGGILTTLISPKNNNNTKINQTNFTCQASSETNYSLTNLTFYLWNSTNLVYNETREISGISNQSTFNYTFLQEDEYKWGCLAFNNNSNSSLTNNFTITYDITKPNITLISPDNGISDTTNSYNFTFNVSDANNISSCYLILDNSIINALSTISKTSANGMYNSSSVGSHAWQINCTDLAGNEENSSLRTLTITSPPIQIQSSGGGGAALTINIYTIVQQQILQGYTKELGKNDKIIFTIYDERYENHTLSLDYIGSNFVNLTLQSEPIKIMLGIGQSIKINLTSPDYYNLYIKLDEIVNNKAKLTIQTIKEQIIPETGKIPEKNESKTNEKPDEGTKAIEEIKHNSIFLIVVAIILIIILFYILEKIERKRNRRSYQSNKKEKN